MYMHIALSQYTYIYIFPFPFSREEFVRMRYSEMVRQAMLFLALLTLFFTCVVPISVYSVATTVLRSPDVTLGIMLYMIYWTQYACNFFLYIFSNVHFRKAVKHFFAVYVLRCGSEWESDDLTSRGALELGSSRLLPVGASNFSKFWFRPELS